VSRCRVGLLAAALVLVVATPAFAQRGPVTKTTVALSAGATTSDLEGGVLIRNTSSRWGFIGGLTGTFRTSQNSMVALEAHYVQKGGADVARLEYIEIPFLFGALIPTMDDRLHFDFYTGIGLGFKVSCSADESAPTDDLCDRANGTEWTWPIGLAVLVRSASGKYFGLDGRYSIGISDAFDGTAARNRSWQFKALIGVPVG
jgi:hypothetical protein